MSSLTDLDPTGVLSAAGAAVGLVGAVLRTVPALKNATHSMKNHSNNNQTSTNLHRAQTASEFPVVGVDPERERRAYETVNFVLREFGTRVCAAGLVDEHALTKALTAASQHIEVNLFSGEANRLFASLAPKLGDPILVNSVFTSIYFIGALTAELARSLPNYKESYTPLGPRFVQQLFRTAIGEDAFRENLSANLDAYKTVATTAGLLRPTDIGYSSFPGFPAFSPCRYSSKSFGDVRNHRLIYEKLVRHFDKSGFPQPIVSRQAEVGLIKEWRFLDADSPSRNFDIEKADKNIGENFGRVIHWLVCSADRLPPGQAVIAYYDQHIELIKWMGQRMGYSVLYAASELNLSGVHSQLDKKLRAVVDTWVLLMPSERAQASRRASSAQWAESHKQSLNQMPPAQKPQPRPSQPTTHPGEPEKKTAVPSSVPPAAPSQSKTGPQFTPKDPGPVPTQQPPKTIDERLDNVDRDFRDIIVPQCQRLLTKPPADPNTRAFEHKRLTQHIERGVIDWLDGFPIPQDHPARQRRKELIVEAQRLLDALDNVNKEWSANATSTNSQSIENITCDSKVGSPTPSTVNPHATPVNVTPNPASPQSVSSPLPSASPPPYSPTTPPSAASSINAGFPFPGKPAIRRKAPPPPKKFIAAKALYDFEPDNDEELAFREGDDIEIIEKTAALEEDGWCRARVQGSKKLGLAPLEYLEIEENPSTGSKPPRSTQSSTSTLPSVAQPQPAHTHDHSNPPCGAHSVDGGSIAGIISSQPSGFSAPLHQANYPQSPQLYAGSPAPTQNSKKLGKGMEYTGLAVATVAGMATYPQGPDSQAQAIETIDILQPTSDTTQVISDTAVTQSPVINEDNVTINQTDNTDVIQNDPSTAVTPPPTTDLSAFSSTPFAAQPLDQTNPIAGLAAVDSSFAAQNPTLASAPDFYSALDTEASPVGMSSGYSVPMMTSPFAAQATPVALNTDAGGMITPKQSLDTIGDQSPVGDVFDAAEYGDCDF